MTRRRSFVRWLAAVGTVPLLAVGLAHTSAAATNYTVYNSENNDLEGSEIVDITPDNKYAVVVGANNVGDATRKETKVRIATIDPNNPGVKLSTLDLTALGTNLGLTRPAASSVAVHPTAGYAIVTLKECVEFCPTTPPETVSAGGAVFVKINTNGTLTLARPAALGLGVQPESIDIAPNGNYAVVANEGQAGRGNGRISIIDLRNGPDGANAQVLTPDIPNAEPEAVAISPDNNRAFVTLQDNNAVAVIDINPTTLSPTANVRDLGNDPVRGVRLNPDGIAVTPDSQYIITANEGVPGTTRANSVSMFRVNADRTLGTPLTRSISAGGDERPEMVAVGQVGGQLRAFVSLENGDAVAVFAVTTGATPAFTLEGQVPLNPSPTGNTADMPEGVAIAHGLDLVVTANQGSRNISIIKATNTNPNPNPNLDEKVYLPLIFR